MTEVIPQVSIGLPVYNGERFLCSTLDSILAQDYGDFELIISDNASEDATGDICQEYAGRDRRIRYYLNKTNLGAVKNFNNVFRLSRGKYFKWAAHDDWIGPRFLSNCLATLERDPFIVVCYTDSVIVDENDGRIYYNLDDRMDLSSPRAEERFHQFLWSLRYCFSVFGLIRSSALRQTGLLRSSVGSDRTLLAELALLGPFEKIPEVMFYYRHPPGARHGRTRTWWDPDNRNRLPFRTWRLCYQYLDAVAHTPLGYPQKLGLMADVLARFAVKDSRSMLKDLKNAGTQLITGHRI